MTSDARRRRDAERAGRLAEGLAAWLLRLKGYRILARDFRCPVGEVDLIARRGHMLVAVEVKRRFSQDAAAEAIGWRQRRRIARATEAYLARMVDGASLSVRFDAVLVGGGSGYHIMSRLIPRHLEDAWRP